MSENNILLNSILSNNSKNWHQGKKDAVYIDFPDELHSSLKQALSTSGIHSLYTHQKDAWDFIKSGKDIVVSTSTSSGKTLCYQMPILQNLINEPSSTALLIYPTKALAQDQLSKFQDLINSLSRFDPGAENIIVAVYDGDTQSSQRKKIRQSANILLTNPDMLHVGILPHHPMWSNFIKNLKFVVIDELHIYRGIFGSHFANVIRRFERIFNFYGSAARYILSSATIANPEEFCSRLIGRTVTVIGQDSSPRPMRDYYFINPPIIDKSLGLRKGMVDQTVEIAEILIKNNIQTLLFARSRKTVEFALLELKQRLGKDFKLEGYRSGYLKKERREIEKNLREGTNSAVISTNALELGIDMGMIDAVVLMGYPGTKTSFFQQSGRAGRRDAVSTVFLVASQSPIDQYVVNNSEFLHSGDTDNALIDPDNPLILINHIKCALFELPFTPLYTFGTLKNVDVRNFLEVLCSMGISRKSNDEYHWVAEFYPAGDISIRNISNNPIALYTSGEIGKTRIGEVDFQSALKTVHQGAVYIHNGVLYRTEELSLEENRAQLVLHDDPYITTPMSEISIEVKEKFSIRRKPEFTFHFDEIHVIERVKSYKKINWETREIIGTYNLDLPELNLITKGFWIGFGETFVQDLSTDDLWTNHPNYYGSSWSKKRKNIIKRDGNKCKVCGQNLQERDLHVHHIKPYRSFSNSHMANDPSNLITLCSHCHRIAERNVRMRSGLSGFTYLFSNLAPIHLMCDTSDIGSFFESNSKINFNLPAVFIYDQFPGGIGLSAKLFSIAEDVIRQCQQVLSRCFCENGCPSCVGPSGENGEGAKDTAGEIIQKLMEK
jgi:DEAD/DEAH box helicase domain-containing protein